MISIAPVNPRIILISTYRRDRSGVLQSPLYQEFHASHRQAYCLAAVSMPAFAIAARFARRLQLTAFHMGGPDMASHALPTLVAPRRSRGAPRSRAMPYAIQTDLMLTNSRMPYSDSSRP